jgi:hypothetical protein
MFTVNNCTRLKYVGHVLYSLHVCVCVGASDSTTTSDDPSSSALN